MEETPLATVDSYGRITLKGLPTGGQLTIGSINDPDVTITTKTNAGQSITDVFDKLAAQPIPAKCPITSMKILTPGMLHVEEDPGMIFVRTTDAGIITAPSPSRFNARPVHALGEVHLSWTLPKGNPLGINIFRGFDRIAQLEGTALSYVDHIAADAKVEADLRYQIVCFNRADGVRIPSDYAEVNSTNPNSMVNDTFEILAHATSGTKGEPYKEVFEKNGGTDPATWTLGSGNLPSGLVMSPSGIVSGTPTVAGTYTFTVAVTDFIGQVTSRDVTLVISALPRLKDLQHRGEK